MAKLRGAHLQISTKDLRDKWVRRKGDLHAYNTLHKELGHERHKVIKDQSIINKLVVQANTGCIKSRNKLVDVNLQFIFTSAKHYSSYGGNILSFCDLITEGSLGLLKSIETYKPGKAQFLSYATWSISHYMINAINQSLIALHIPNTQKDRFYKANYIEDTRYFQNAADEDFLGGEYTRAFESIDNFAENKLGHRDLFTEFERALEKLTPREADVLRLHYYSYPGPLNFDEIGDIFNLTRERIRQIKEEAILKLKYSNYSKHLQAYIGFEFDESLLGPFRKELEREEVEFQNRKKAATETIQKRIEARRTKQEEELLERLSDTTSFFIEIDEKRYKVNIVNVDMENQKMECHILNYELSKILNFDFEDFLELNRKAKIINLQGESV